MEAERRTALTRSLPRGAGELSLEGTTRISSIFVRSRIHADTGSRCTALRRAASEAGDPGLSRGKTRSGALAAALRTEQANAHLLWWKVPTLKDRRQSHAIRHSPGVSLARHSPSRITDAPRLAELAELTFRHTLRQPTHPKTCAFTVRPITARPSRRGKSRTRNGNAGL